MCARPRFIWLWKRKRELQRRKVRSIVGLWMAKMKTVEEYGKSTVAIEPSTIRDSTAKLK